MIRLLIAEDEKVVRETISNIIDWRANDIELIGACENGIEAYDMVMDEYPDIVLTDIRMPGMSGLELIERAQGLDKDIEFIILSGYGEFEYAKKAMKYGVKNYLLKPCDEGQILEAIQSLREDISRKQAAHIMKKERELIESRFDILLKKQFTIEAVTGTDDFATIMARYQSSFYFPVGTYYVYYISYLDEELLPEQIKALSPMKHLYRFEFCFNSLYVKGTSILMLTMTRDTDKAGFDRALAEMRLPGQTVECECWWEAYELVQDMLETVVKKLQRHNRFVVVNSDHSLQEVYNYATPFRQARDIVGALDGMREEAEIAELTGPFFGDVADPDLARMLSMRLVSQTASRSDTGSKLDYAQFLSALYELDRVEDIHRLTLEQLRGVSGRQSRREGQYKDFVARAMQYVRENMADPELSMKWLAENVLYMNVDYFSRQFTRQTGEKFSAYLNRVRMERARELILSYGSDHIYEVAEQVGCGHNPQYFSQLFKKHTGMTPSQYREANKDAAAHG